LNYSLCGDPYWTMDIGGFCVENRYANAQRMFDRTNIETPDLTEWRELQTRWYQFGTFCPLYRAHGQFPLREVWNIAPENHPAYKSIVEYNKLRYRLMPYIYSLAGRSWLFGSVIMRGLVMDFTEDRKAMDVGDQFMFGPSIMVCPVYEYGARSRDVYLPEGRVWYDFYNDTVTYAGGQTITADAPYERIPLFVPSGSIIISGPDIEYVDQVPADRLTIDVYSGSGGRFILYEDDGVSFGYENGKYTTIPIYYTENESGNTLSIGKRSGEYSGMTGRRDIKVRMHFPDGVKERTLVYTGDRIDVTIN